MIVYVTLFLHVYREHNRIADLLKAKIPNLNEEGLFQNARRLLIAEYQNIVYGEYVPIILGKVCETFYTIEYNSTHVS